MGIGLPLFFKTDTEFISGDSPNIRDCDMYIFFYTISQADIIL
jgi:hypothetical protein